MGGIFYGKDKYNRTEDINGYKNTDLILRDERTHSALAGFSAVQISVERTGGKSGGTGSLCDFLSGGRLVHRAKNRQPEICVGISGRNPVFCGSAGCIHDPEQECCRLLPAPCHRICHVYFRRNNRRNDIIMQNTEKSALKKTKHVL